VQQERWCRNPEGDTGLLVGDPLLVRVQWRAAAEEDRRRGTRATHLAYCDPDHDDRLISEALRLRLLLLLLLVGLLLRRLLRRLRLRLRWRRRRW